MQVAGACDRGAGAFRRRRVAHKLLDQGAGVGVALERGLGVGELACGRQDFGYGGDAICLAKGLVKNTQ